MLAKKVPVKGVEGTSIGTLPHFRIEAARGAVVAHLFLIGRSRRIGFGGEETAISKKNHAKNVGNHDPVIGVEVHLGIPAEDGLGFVATQEKVVSKHHETLDVMIVGVIDGAVNGLGNAAHFSLSGVSPAGKGASSFEKINLAVLRHFEPVDAVDEFAPTKNLADKAFDGIERGFAFAVGFFRGLNAFLRGEKA